MPSLLLPILPRPANNSHSVCCCCTPLIRAPVRHAPPHEAASARKRPIMPAVRCNACSFALCRQIFSLSLSVHYVSHFECLSTTAQMHLAIAILASRDAPAGRREVTATPAVAPNVSTSHASLPSSSLRLCHSAQGLAGTLDVNRRSWHAKTSDVQRLFSSSPSLDACSVCLSCFDHSRPSKPLSPSLRRRRDCD